MAHDPQPPASVTPPALGFDEQFRQLFAVCPDGVIVVDAADLRVLAANAAMCGQLGREPAELIGLHLLDLHPADEHARAALEFGRVRDHGPLAAWAVRVMRRDGSVYLADISASHAELGGRACVIGFVRDVTARDEAERRSRLKHDLMQALAACDSLEEGMRLSLDAAIEAGRMDSGGFYTVDGASDLVLQVHRGLSEAFVNEVGRLAMTSPQGRLAASGTPLYVAHGELAAVSIRHLEEEGLRSLAAVPLLHHGRVVGCLNVASHSLDTISEPTRVALETIAAGAAQAIARLGAQRQLLESEARFRGLFDHALEGVALLSDDLKVLRVNLAFARMHGYDSPEELLAMPIAGLQGAPVAAQTADRVRRILEEGALDFEVDHRRRDGSIFPVSVHSCRIEIGERGYFLAFHRDISDARRAETALRESEERLRKLVENAADGLLALDPRTCRFLSANEAARALYGAPDIESLVGRRPWELSPELQPGGRSSVEAGRELLDWALRDGRCAFEWVHRRFDGREILTLVQLVRVGEGEQTTLQASVRDITESRRAEEALADSEFFVRLALEIGGIGAYRIDLPSRKATWSPGIARIWGLPPGFDDDLMAWACKHVHEDDSARVAAFYRGLLERGEEDETDFRIRRPDGEIRWLRWRGRAFHDRARDSARLIGVHLDITERKRLEEEREAALVKYRTLFDSLPLGLAVTDKKGQLLEYNRVAEALLGIGRAGAPIPHGDALGWRTVREDGSEFPPDERPGVRALREQRVIADVELGLVRGPSEISWLRVTAAPVPLPDVGVVVAYSDVSERRAHTAALAEREEIFSKIIAQAADSIAVVDGATGRFVEFNTAAHKDLGYSREEFAALGIPDIQAEHSLDEIRANIVRVREHGETSFETLHRHRDGSLRNVVVRIQRLNIKGRDYQGAVWTDVTEQRRAHVAQRADEERLRASEERFRHLVEASFDWIWEMDADGRTVYASPRSLGLIGYPPEAMIGRLPSEFAVGEEGTRVSALLAQALARPAPFSSVEMTYRHAEGRNVTMEASGIPVYGPDGRFAGYRGMSRDVTERKRLEEQFRQAQKLEAVGQLAGGVAHDFNNVLAAILMHIGLLQDSPLDGEVREGLGEIEAAAQRAATLTRQLLMFSRRSVLSLGPVDLNDVVANLIKMLSRLIGEHIELRFDRFPSLPSIEADAGMMDQVVLNLVVNARDAMPAGGRIRITTEVVDVISGGGGLAGLPDRRPGRYVALSVFDNGCGMDAATLGRIFEPFFTTKEPGKGTGLGLATVHGIVAQHKGWVEVESTVGKGSAFRVLLPAITQAAEAAPSEQRQRTPRGQESVLVVEDDENVRTIVGRTLSRLGYRVHVAASGPEALRLWELHGAEVRLLLTDMVMSAGMTGLELAETLRRSSPALKVILVSGYSAEMTHATLAAHITYLPKPFTPRVLGEVVRKCLDG